jgi:hypothetical protein
MPKTNFLLVLVTEDGCDAEGLYNDGRVVFTLDGIERLITPL